MYLSLLMSAYIGRILRILSKVQLKMQTNANSCPLKRGGNGATGYA